MVDAADIVACARSYVGVRYGHQGRSRKILDCLGLLVGVCYDMKLRGTDGAPLHERDESGYSRLATNETMLTRCAQSLIPVQTRDARPADVLVTAWARGQRHIGIVGDHPAGGLTLIHAYQPSRKVIEQRLDEALLARALGVFRFPEVA